MKFVYFPCAGSFVHDSFENALSNAFGKENILEISGYGNKHDEWNETICSIVQRLKDTIQNDEYILIGCSMGGIVAYEVCKKIQQKKCIHMPRQSVIISSTPPNKMKINIEKVTIHCISEINKLYSGVNLRMINIMKEKLKKDLLLLSQYTYKQDDCKIDVDSRIVYSSEDSLVFDIYSWSLLFKPQCEFIELSGGHFLMYNNIDKIIELIKNDVDKYRISGN